jgi:hypothetical protein
MTEPTRRVTISFAVPSKLHGALGAGLILVFITAWWVHFALPAGHAYKPTTADIASLAGSAGLAYWLFCVVQHNRSEAADFDERATAAIAEAVAREKRLIAAYTETTNAVLAVFREISEAVAENRGSIKELQDAVDEGTNAVEALQNCYLREGTVLVLPNQRDSEEAPRDIALRA